MSEINNNADQNSNQDDTAVQFTLMDPFTVGVWFPPALDEPGEQPRDYNPRQIAQYSADVLYVLDLAQYYQDKQVSEDAKVLCADLKERLNQVDQDLQAFIERVQFELDQKDPNRAPLASRGPWPLSYAKQSSLTFMYLRSLIRLDQAAFLMREQFELGGFYLDEADFKLQRREIARPFRRFSREANTEARVFHRKRKGWPDKAAEEKKD